MPALLQGAEDGVQDGGEERKRQGDRAGVGVPSMAVNQAVTPRSR